MGFSQAASSDLRLTERLPLEFLIPQPGNGPLALGFRATLQDTNAPSNGIGHSFGLFARTASAFRPLQLRPFNSVQR
jgi:hypothetical protein